MKYLNLVFVICMVIGAFCAIQGQDQTEILEGVGGRVARCYIRNRVVNGTREIVGANCTRYVT